MAIPTKVPFKYRVCFYIAKLLGYEMRIEHSPFTKYPPTIISIRKLYK